MIIIIIIITIIVIIIIVIVVVVVVVIVAIVGRIETIRTTVLLRSVFSTEKSPSDLRRLAVTQTPVKDHHLTLGWITCKE